MHYKCRTNIRNCSLHLPLICGIPASKQPLMSLLVRYFLQWMSHGEASNGVSLCTESDMFYIWLAISYCHVHMPSMHTTEHVCGGISIASHTLSLLRIFGVEWSMRILVFSKAPTANAIAHGRLHSVGCLGSYYTYSKNPPCQQPGPYDTRDRNSIPLGHWSLVKRSLTYRLMGQHGQKDR